MKSNGIGNELKCCFEDLIGEVDRFPLAELLTPIGASTPQCELALCTNLRGVLHKAGQMLGNSLLLRSNKTSASTRIVVVV